MAGIFDNPFDPTEQGASTGGPGIAQEWSAALNDPNIRGALLQAGISLMQPPSFGDNTASQIGRAIGGAGEYYNRVQEDERKAAADARAERDTDSKETLRTAQADTAASRARVAEANAGTAAERLQRLRDQDEYRRSGLRTSQLIKAQGLYNNYVRETEKNNNNVLMDPKKRAPILGFDEWLARNPMLRDSLTTGGGGGSTPNPAAEPPVAPSDPASRTKDTIYTTPRGPMKWTGEGWLPI